MKGRQAFGYALLFSLIAAGAPEMIVVMPDGDDSWYTTGSAIGRYQACRAAPREGDIRRIGVHDGPILSAALHPDGKRLKTLGKHPCIKR